jgi:hypothetical protein
MESEGRRENNEEGNPHKSGKSTLRRKGEKESIAGETEKQGCGGRPTETSKTVSRTY